MKNKTVVYTIAGVAVVVTGAGAVYYFSVSRKDTVADNKKKTSKKERRKAKKDKEKLEAELLNVPKEVDQPGNFH